jgi:DNA-binding SARP family transcriptional activator
LLDLAGYLAELLDEPGVLVIDDYSEADGQECDPLVAETLPILSSESLIVVCSRGRPPGLVGRVAEGVLRCVEAPELAFTPDEARQLFEMVGSNPAEAARACEELGGWAAGVAVAATTGYPARPEALAGLVTASLGTGDLVEAMSVLPYLTAELAAELGVGDDASLSALGRGSMLVFEQGGEWRLSRAAAQVVAPRVVPERRRQWRADAARALSGADPATAIDLLVEDGSFEDAVLLARQHLSAIPAERAVRWLYRIPDEVRHQLPPALAAGRATVDLDAATAAAEEAVHRSTGGDSRREAMFGLGSAHLHAGRLADAAAALEVACGPGSPPRLVATASGWLAAARWWSGDLAGAMAAAAPQTSDPVAAWVAAEIGLARGEWAEPLYPCLGGDAVRAKALLSRDALAEGAGMAEASYQLAAAEGGFAVAVAGPVHAWYLVATGDLGAALAVADVVNRGVGRHDAFASLHVWLVRLAVASALGNRADMEEANKRVARIRLLGFAPIEAQARSLLSPLAASAPTGLEVAVLGVMQLKVDGKPLGTAWRSMKALEVLAYLALRGQRGAQREEIIEAVWPDREPEKGRMLLRAALSEVRRRLEPGRPAGEPSRFLVTSGERIVLVATVDAASATAHAKAGQAAEALAQFRGQLLEDMPYSDWATDDRGVLATLRAELADRTARDESAPVGDRIAALELLIATEPWRADLYDLLFRVHTMFGNDAAAVEVERRRLEAADD